MDTKRYTKLFNFGYFLAKHEPKLLQSIQKASKEAPELAQPLSAGEQQYQQEQVGKRVQRIKRKRGDQGRDRD